MATCKREIGTGSHDLIWGAVLMRNVWSTCYQDYVHSLDTDFNWLLSS